MATTKTQYRAEFTRPEVDGNVNGFSKWFDTAEECEFYDWRDNYKVVSRELEVLTPEENNAQMRASYAAMIARKAN